MNGRSLLALLPVLVVSPVVAASPPANNTYFTILVGLDAPYSWHGECLSFTETELCSSDGDCGTWSRTGPAGLETAFTFEVTYLDGGEEVRIEGQGRVDPRGSQNSLAAVARVEAAGRSSNFGITGRSADRRKCSRILRDFMNDGVMKTPECYQRAHFGDPADSEYVRRGRRCAG